MILPTKVKQKIQKPYPGPDPGAEVKFQVNDDDGSFIRAGYSRTVMTMGSYPYGDEQYHLPGDTPERVDIVNLALSVKLLLAAVMDLGERGEAAFEPR